MPFFKANNAYTANSTSRGYMATESHYDSYVYYPVFVIGAGASPGFGRGGGKKLFFQIWIFACREATCCAWRSHALC